MDEGLSREEYIRLLAKGYARTGIPVPDWIKAEFDLLPALPPLPPLHLTLKEQVLALGDIGPLELWAEMDSGKGFKLEPVGPAHDGVINMMGSNWPSTGAVQHCTLRDPDGTILATIGLQQVVPIVTGDTMTVQLSAETVVQHLGG